jgi:hypothetical protein
MNVELPMPALLVPMPALAVPMPVPLVPMPLLPPWKKEDVRSSRKPPPSCRLEDDVVRARDDG